MSSAGKTDLSDGLPALAHDESHLITGDADHLGDVKVGARIIVTTCDCVVVGGHPASLEAGQLALLGTRQRGLVPHDSWQPPQPPRFL